MTSNISKLTKIAQLLDHKGYYALSDKVESLIKTSQNLFSTVPGKSAPTPPPKTGNPLIDNMYVNMSDTAAGSGFAGGGMFDMKSPYRSETGPSGPLVLPTLSPAQFAELSKTEQGRAYIAQLQLSGAQKAQNQINLTNLGFISLGKFIAQNLAPGIAQDRKQEVIKNILPGTIATQLGNLLARTPVNKWESSLKELENVANSSPGYSNEIIKMINIAKKSAIEDIKYQDATYYNRIISDPEYKQFADKNNL